MVPFGQGRRSRKSRARAVGAPARSSRGCRSLGRVQAAVARVASRSAPRVHPLRFADSRGGRAPSPPRIVRISRLSRSANENQLRSESNVCRPFRAAKPRANGRCMAGCEATRHCKAASPAHTAPAPHPASPRRLRAPRAPTPAAPRRLPLLGGPGRQRTALVRRRPPGRRPCAAAHTGRREDEARPEGERRSDGRGMRGGIAKQDREGGKPFPNTGGKRTRAAWRMGSR